MDQGAQTPRAPLPTPLKCSTTNGSTWQPALLFGGGAVGWRRLHHPTRGRDEPTYRAATAQTDGGSAARRGVEKTSQYRRYGPGCYHVVTLTVETYGRLGKPFMKLITDVEASAAQQGDDTFTRNQFITGVLPELSVCLCRRNANIEHAVSGCFVRVSGGAYMPGLVQPTADVE
jgi:hypothetical protein